MEGLKRTDASTVKRLKDRGIYDRKTVNEILDAGFLCHVAYQIHGQPYCTPTMHWRSGDHVYWHGSSVSRFLEQAVGKPVCLTVTHADGFVLARSAFNHSMNYRSAMLFGEPELVEGEEKLVQLKKMVDHLFRGRWDALRPVKPKELNATTVLRLKIDEGACKVREGHPSDNREDYELPIWAGVIPLAVSAEKPVPDPANKPEVDMPAHVADYRLPHRR